ncbi:TetR/AcrR family transcriptional regulator [Hellea balneolensis]|uniref:TetR/AcrR family transcriptional regulator n=1 Tax=Hellea balneolensis TaxID=287478 RepID=UPI00040A70F9|nr:TetR/AcrR family transcriptional regulator [Hellea balneolensis]
MAERSKTKEKILKTALGLFNNEGESAVSSVDIASVIGISPGNLYYHYKGKDEIIVELFADYEEEIRQVLGSPVREPLKLEDNWVYLYIIFEEIFDFRFFYKNQSELIDRIPALRSKFARILSLKEQTALALLSTLEEQGHLTFDEGEKTALGGRIAQHFTFWLQYHDLRHGHSSRYSGPPKSLIDQGVFMTLIQITPYWTHGEGYAELLKDFVSDKT